MKTAPVKTDRDNGSFIIISLTECQETLSERQFGKQKHDTYFVWSLHSHTKRWTKRWYWFLYVLGTLMIFSRSFPQTMKLNHSVLSCSEGGSLWRLLCSLHPKTQHLKSLFSADIVYIEQLQQVNSDGRGGPQLFTQGCVYAYRAASQMGGTFSPQWREQRENLKQLVLRDCLWFF